jgi:hypothetical protein
VKKAVILVLFSVMLFGLPVCAAIFNPNNGHYYERIDKDITWTAAKSEAEGMTFMDVHGHLATITSNAENSWIVENLGGPLTLDHWLGGYLYDGKWTWVTGEPWGYTNWWPGEPNNLTGWESVLEFDDAEGNPPDPGFWNDFDVRAGEDGYIVEFDAKPVPIVSTFWLLGTGFFGFVALLKKSKK